MGDIGQPTAEQVAVSRALALQVNIVKLLGLACLAPPATVGIAQQASAALPDGQEAAAVATITSLGILTGAIGALFLARASDRFPESPRWHWQLITGASVIGILGLVLMVVSSSIWALSAGWLIAQLGFTGAMAVLRTLLSFTHTVQRRRGAVMMVMFSYIGAFIPMVAIILFPGSLWITTLGIAALATAVPALLISRSPNSQPRLTGKYQSALETAAAQAKVTTTMPWPVILLVYFGANMLFVTHVAYHALEIAEQQDGSWADDTVRISMTLLAAALIGLVLFTSILLARPQLLGNPIRLILFAGLLMAGSVALRASVSSFAVLTMALFLTGIAYGVNACAILTAALDSARADQAGKRIGFYSAVGLLGQLVAPPLGLLVIALSPEGDGYRNVFICVAILPLLWSAAVFFTSRARASTDQG